MLEYAQAQSGDSAVVHELQAISAALQLKLWRDRPDLWVNERLRMHVWSKQREILHSVRTHRKTVVKSCHGPGKSFVASCAATWWVDVHRPGEAVVVTTAPTGRQVRAILWKEIRRAHSRGNLAGRTNQTEWYITPPGMEEEAAAFGMKPADYAPGAFQGVHARRVLVIFDEACGIPSGSEDKPSSLWTGAEGLLTNDECRALYIGNPDEPGTEFERLCRPGSDANVITIDAFCTPNFTGEEIPEELSHLLIGRTWVEERRKQWAPTWRWSDDGKRLLPPEGESFEEALERAHPLLQSKVFAVFPKNSSEQGLISILQLQAACDREIPDASPIELGVDVGAGGDASTSALRKGGRVRIISCDRNPDTMQTAGKVVSEMREHSVTSVKVDSIGIGKGIYDRGSELSLPFVSINVGEAAEDSEQFLNRRAELYWGLRERFEAGDIDIDPADEELQAELLAIRYARNSRGQIVIEEKKAIRKRLGRSPDRAEAVMLAFAKERVAKKKTKGQGRMLW